MWFYFNTAVCQAVLDLWPHHPQDENAVQTPSFIVRMVRLRATVKLRRQVIDMNMDEIVLL